MADLSSSDKVCLPSSPATKPQQLAFALRRVIEEAHVGGREPSMIRVNLYTLEAVIEALCAAQSHALPSEIEDALWLLHSYESNRDDGGRHYSEADITRMVEAVRSHRSATRRSTPPCYDIDGNCPNYDKCCANGRCLELFRSDSRSQP